MTLSRGEEVADCPRAKRQSLLPDPQGLLVKMRNFFIPSCGIIVSSVLIIVGLFFLLIFPFVLQFFVKKEFQLSPTSQSFQHWRKIPIPVSLDIYLFNWTNPEDITKTKPVLQELGPYRFYETREKLNLTWNKNATISYHQRRVWKFSESESNGSLDDIVTTINGVSLTAAYKVRHSGYLRQQPLNIAFGFTRQKMFETHSVSELLFDGYTNNLMTFANKISPAISSMSSPFDKFAWFYVRNTSFTFDGWFNVDTGENDISRLGTIRRWNNKDRTGFYSGKCGYVKGYTGDIFPPGLIGRNTSFDLFSPDLCRAIQFDYTGDTDIRGLQSHRFAAVIPTGDNEYIGTEEPCGCNGECVPSGILNLTVCRYGAPVFVSFPHFYDANPFYLKQVEGLHPDRQKHEFYFTIEPTFGIPVDVGARVQLNMLMQPASHISMYEKVPKLMFPILWVDQRVTITERLARELRLAIMLPLIGTLAGVFALSIGSILFVVIVVRARRKDAKKEIAKPS